MASATLVRDWVAAIDAVEDRWGSVPFALLLPVEDSSAETSNGERYTLVLTAPWALGSGSPQTGLVRIVQTLQGFPDFLAKIETVSVIESTHSLVQETAIRYLGRIRELPAPIAEPFLGGRASAGGWILRISDLDYPPIHVGEEAHSGSVQSVSLKPELARLFDDNDHVRAAPVSEEKVLAFFEKLRRDREAAGTFEALLNAAGMRVLTDAEQAEGRGITMLVNKGPFVDGANWFPLASWDFALALEKDASRQLRRVLQGKKASLRSDRESWQEIRANVSEALKRIDAEKPLILFDGRPTIDVSRDIALQSGPRVEERLRRFSVLGEVFECPVVRLPLDEGATRVHVLDLSRAIKFTRGRVPGTQDLIKFSLKPLGSDDIERKVQDDAFWASLPNLDSAWKRRFLQERVVLRIYEFVRIEPLDAHGWITIGLK